ncbi:HupE/UreJ family protein [Marinilongibacter aquaticus]|uniref:HupE/UreJ family protein n=1 Tax=Marinilongibacter aquaticus TaxID=2975157 RepID=UPI0021BD2174|nr:HupE/UreJ family protein [Marinilongibacter aquaticus]UBM60650.1 HupE/UreJ family protein [Marinilongibacter aquaticus]
MLSTFKIYFTLGLQHITDLNGYDHILFLIALCAIYSLSKWKEVLWLVTAFTLGHSITLALAVLDWVNIQASLVEALIPVTIMFTSLLNLSGGSKRGFSSNKVRYLTAALFGLIHGLGFSNYLKSLLGGEEQIALPLFSFNLGLEMGQICIVIPFLLINHFLLKLFQKQSKMVPRVISLIAFVLALTMLLERI